LICLHGWGAGRYEVEERAFVVPWLVDRLGLDVVLMTLPFHALRSAGSRRTTPEFPSPNPIRSNEGFGHAIQDLRALMFALRHTYEVPAISVTGMSLGGFTTALLATIEPDLDAAVPIIPFASLPHLIWRHGRRTRARRAAIARGVTEDIFAEAFEAITPVLRPAAIPTERIMIAAAERDRVTPPTHAAWLHQHFRGSHFPTFSGAHIVQLGRRTLFKSLAAFLTSHGLAEDRRGILPSQGAQRGA